MINRRKFMTMTVQIVFAGLYLPIAEMIQGCTYKKAEDLDNEFNQKNRKIRLISPNGGEFFDQVDFIEVLWEVENVSTIHLLLSYDNGLAWQFLKQSIPAATGYFRWELPKEDMYAESCLLKIESGENETLFDLSDANFKISKTTVVKKSIQLDFPDEYKILQVGKEYQISWTYENINAFDLQLWIDGVFWKEIINSITQNSFTWKVPSANTKDAKIKVLESGSQMVYDLSDVAFAIADGFEIDLTVNTELLVIGGYKIFTVPNFDQFVLKRVSLTTFETYSMVCTHNGCIIGIQSNQSFRCSCHGSEFDASGNVTNGPASLPLIKYSTFFDSLLSKVTVYNIS